MNLARIAKGARQIGRLPEVFAAAGATPQWAALTASYLGAADAKFPRMVRFRAGQQLELQTFADLQTVWRIFFFGEYPVRPADLRIIDAGANCGFFTLYCAMRSPQARIASVEPFPATFARLQQTIAANRVGDRVTAFEAALFGKDGQTQIDARPETGSQFRRVGSDGLRIPAVSLQTLLERCGWERADFLKLDIEGSEFEVLLNAAPEVLRRIGRIAMEFHPRYDEKSYTPELLTGHLERNGFRIVLRRDDEDGYGVIHAQNTSTTPASSKN